MNKTIFVYILCLFSTLCAQNKQSKITYITTSNTDKYIVVDSVKLRIWYALNALDVTDENSYIDLEILDIGRKQNKYYSYWVWKSDSLMTDYNKRNKGTGVFPSALLPNSRGGRGYWNELQYHSLFIKDNIVRTYTREYDKSFNGYYDEPYPDISWQLCEETDTVCGVLCQKAKCLFHGREFIAWFSRDISIPFGPWKMGGLPGLIVKVYDVDKFYTFECVKIERVNCPMLSNPYKNFREINRKKILLYERKINENYPKTCGVLNMDGTPISHYTPYEPIEKE